MRLTTLILFVFVIVITLWRMAPNLDNHPFYIDEHEFVRKSYFFNLYFIKHDLKDPRWYDTALEGGALQPKVGPYIYGFVYHLMGYTDIEKTFTETGFNTITVGSRPWYEALWLKEPNTFPPQLRGSMKLIGIARRVALIFTVGSVALLFLLCTLLVSPIFAYAASILVVANPLFTWEGRFAMTDTMQLFFFFLGLLFLVLWQRAWNGKKPFRTYGLSIGIGLVSALATGVKVTGIMIFLFAIAYCTFLCVTGKSKKKRVREFVVAMGLLIITFCGLFYILHPYLYSDPIHNFYAMFHNRFEDAHTFYFDEFPDSAIPSRLLAIRRIYIRTLAPNASYGNFPLWGLPVDLLLFIGGIGMLIRSVKTRILPLWIGFIFLCLVFYLYNDWSRYFLPAVVGVCMAQGYAIIWIISRGLKHYKTTYPVLTDDHII
jgi:4-amino-4-deoxy-L-arabinose transferase-like glycosyltransferase